MSNGGPGRWEVFLGSVKTTKQKVVILAIAPEGQELFEVVLTKRELPLLISTLQKGMQEIS